MEGPGEQGKEGAPSTTDAVAKPEVAPVPKEDKETKPVSTSRQGPANVVPLVIKAMDSIDVEGEWFPLGQLGQYITRANPDFDSRTYGSAKLSDLLLKTGRFEMRKGQGNQPEVRRLD